ncbi:porin [Janthinobacterium sp. 17J80-10]|uniref:porin n=1 Tax=Janthinobacterium sp. 17J80-10 TaxID=2497863 RepID=UPI0010055050|nr:porin [Janthinobacterium sp. 17J80-10]QAU34009.1 porin [Janthinobacterium sp. 17J80-10]
MKKSLIALAVLGAFASAAQAQTNVQIGGRVQATVKSYKVGDTARVANNELRIDDDETSRFWLSGTEDLGGGLKALFYVENRFNTDQRQSTGLANGSGLADGNTYVGLAGNFGQVTAGKHTFMEDQGNAVQYGAKGTQAVPSGLLGSKAILNYVDGVGAANRVGISTSRVVNSLQYITPNFSGFKGIVGYSTQPNGAEGVIGAPAGVNYSKGQAYFLAGNYSNGPVFANLAYYDHAVEGRPGVGDQKQVRLSASYAFPFGLKAGFQYDRASIEAVGTDRTRNAWQVPVSYQFGASTILASYTKAGDVNGEANSGAKLWTLGYDYALSKRTNVGVFVGKLNNDSAASYQVDGAGTSQNGTTLLAGESARIIQLAVKHTF